MDNAKEVVEEILSDRPVVIAACTHGNDAAVHADATAWARTVAEGWHKEAPPISEGRRLHFEYGLHKRHESDAFSSCPERFDDCARINRNLLGDAWGGLCLELDAADGPIAPSSTIAPSDMAAAEQEAANWARAWAERLYNEAPRRNLDYEGHLMHKLRRLWTNEVRGTFPQHLRAYGFAPGDLALHAMHAYDTEQHDKDFPPQS